MPGSLPGPDLWHGTPAEKNERTSSVPSRLIERRAGHGRSPSSTSSRDPLKLPPGHTQAYSLCGAAIAGGAAARRLVCSAYVADDLAGHAPVRLPGGWVAVVAAAEALSGVHALMHKFRFNLLLFPEPGHSPQRCPHDVEHGGLYDLVLATFSWLPWTFNAGHGRRTIGRSSTEKRGSRGSVNMARVIPRAGRIDSGRDVGL